MARALRYGVCIRCSGHEPHWGGFERTGPFQVATSRSSRGRMLSTRLFASDAPPKRDNSFPQKLMENLRLRLGLKRRIVSTPPPEGGLEEELEKELAREIQEDDVPVATKRAGGEVVFEQEERDIRAEDVVRPLFTNPGFSFSAAGHLFPYHLGACKCLMEHGYITENTPLAGSSAGALVCAVVAGGLDMSEALLAAKEVSQDCRNNGTAFRVGNVLRGIMEKYLPMDIHTRVNGKIRVAVTQIFRKPKGLIVDHFESKEDLIEALHTSCYIPGYFARKPVTIFRDRVCIDGGFTLFMPPTAAEETIRICALYPSAYRMGNVQISPECNPSESRPGNQMLLNLALIPAEDDVLDRMFQFGYEDATCWVRTRI